jgi:inorganic triphosphatase YgiF
MATIEFNEQEIKFYPKHDIQVKLASSIQQDPIDGLINTIMNALNLSNIYTLEPLNSESLTDTYYDTADLTLYNERNCLRVRTSGKKISITVKLNKGVIDGHFNRDEFTLEADQSTLQRELNENFADIVRSHLKYISGRRLNNVIEIRNDRKIFEMRPKDGLSMPDEFRAKLSLDSFVLINPRSRHTSPALYELEIEALNDQARTRLSEISQTIRKLAPNFIASPFSKYEQGIKYYKLDKSIMNKRLRLYLMVEENLTL